MARAKRSGIALQNLCNLLQQISLEPLLLFCSLRKPEGLRVQDLLAGNDRRTEQHVAGNFWQGPNQEGCTGPRSKGRVATFDSLLDVLWVMVLPPDNNQVFKPPGNENLTRIDKSQIASSQIAGDGVTSYLCIKDLSGLLWVLPVTLGN